MSIEITDETKDLSSIAKNVAACVRCQLNKGRTMAVPGDGDPNADIVLIGEGPGKNEDLQGKPFVGAAGKFLEEMLAAIKMTREQVFITNVVKCRPPNNRDPLPGEVSACTTAWLGAQLHHIDPKVIVTLGRHSLGHFIQGKSISECHGKPFRTTSPDGARRVFYPLYHPAAALYNGSLRETLLADFKKIPKILKLVDEDKQKQDLLQEMSAD